MSPDSENPVEDRSIAQEDAKKLAEKIRQEIERLESRAKLSEHFQHLKRYYGAEADDDITFLRRILSDKGRHNKGLREYMIINCCRTDSNFYKHQHDLRDYLKKCIGIPEEQS